MTELYRHKVKRIKSRVKNWSKTERTEKKLIPRTRMFKHDNSIRQAKRNVCHPGQEKKYANVIFTQGSAC